ncbi:putative reverse transcriptase domain-containing protein [Tanacetum coccineum]
MCCDDEFTKTEDAWPEMSSTNSSTVSQRTIRRTPWHRHHRKESFQGRIILATYLSRCTKIGPSLRYFMGPFPSSNGKKYILVAIDNVSKWVEAQAFPTSDAGNVVNFLMRLFAQFGIPKALISDRGTHFYNYQMEKAMKRYGVVHRFSTAYHPQTNGHVEKTNRAIKRIPKKTIGNNKKDWSYKLDDALWAFHTAFKTPLGTTPFRIIYGKACHLPINELDEMRLDTYESSISYKERTKRWHDKRIKLTINYKNGDKVLLFNSRLRLFLGKLKSRWYGPFTVSKDMKNGAIELYDEEGSKFIVNKQRVKPYQKNLLDTNKDDDVTLEDEGEFTLWLFCYLDFFTDHRGLRGDNLLRRRDLVPDTLSVHLTDLPSTSSGPSRKRRRSPMTSVPTLSPVSRALSPVRADLIPSSKRVKDSGYLTDVEMVYESIVRFGSEVQMITLRLSQVPRYRLSEGSFKESYGDHRIVAVIALTERIAELERDNRRLRDTMSVESQRVDQIQRGKSRMQRELRQVTRRVAEEMEAREAARTLEPLNENVDEQEGENGGNRGNGNGENRNGNRNGNHGMNYGGFIMVARECTFQDFLKCKPHNFSGTEGVVGLTRWFEKMETVFNISNFPLKYQVKYATCTLQDSALTWWNSHKRTIGAEATYAMNWVKLMKLITEVYCPRNENRVEAGIVEF